MIKTEGIDFKKQYFWLLKDLVKMAHYCERERCPWAKQCCTMCHLMKEKITKEKKRLSENNEENEHNPEVLY